MASISQGSIDASVSSFHALICSKVIGAGPLKPDPLLELKAIKADQTWDISMGKGVGASNASILRPVCLSTCSRCSRSVVPF